ncbi:MAG: bactofilin family protein [Rubrivivax sp.]
MRSLLCELPAAHGALTFVGALGIGREVRRDVLALSVGGTSQVMGENARVPYRGKTAHVMIKRNGCGFGPLHPDVLESQPKARVVGDVRYGTSKRHHGASIYGEFRSLK